MHLFIIMQSSDTDLSNLGKVYFLSLDKYTKLVCYSIACYSVRYFKNIM